MDPKTGLPRRIVKETQRLQTEPIAGISCVPFEDNPRHFKVVMAGPGETPYENGVFHLELFLPGEYPMTPPKVRFLTKIYHPNIDGLGRICLDILKDKWSPALQIGSMLLSIQALLSSPEPDDPLGSSFFSFFFESFNHLPIIYTDANIAEHFKTNPAEATKMAKEWTEKFATVK